MVFRNVGVVEVFIILLLGFITSASAQRIFRSKADSIKYFKIIEEMGDERRDDTDDLFLRAESYLVKEIYKDGYYCSYKDLIKSNRRDTILHIGLYALDIKRIPNEVFDCTNLVELDISSCKIKRLPIALNNLKSLASVAINKSKLRGLRIDFTSNESIQRLDLSYNKFRRIPKGVKYLEALRYLNVTDNKIRRLSMSLNNCTKLDKINLSYNKVHRV